MPLPSAPVAVAIGDLNADGNPDLVVTDGSNSVAIRLGTGDGTFGAAVVYFAGSESPAIGDFDGDGIPDLAVADPASDSVSILIGIGDGTFASAVSYAAGGFAALDLPISDLTTVRRQGAISRSPTPTCVSILFGDDPGNNPMGPVLLSRRKSDGRSIVTADFNGEHRQATVSRRERFSPGTSSPTRSVPQLPDLAVTMTHLGRFTQGDTGKTYTIGVKNAGTAGTTTR